MCWPTYENFMQKVLHLLLAVQFEKLNDGAVLSRLQPYKRYVLLTGS